MAGKMAFSSFEHPIMSEVTPTSRRKADHIRINLEEDVASGLSTGLEHLRFEHRAVPELNLNQVDPSLTFLGKQLKSPLLISSMTGGTPLAAKINRNLALTAQAEGIALALGSQRAAIEDPALRETYDIRKVAPDALLLANLGAIQLNYGYGVEHCLRAVEMVAADGLILHFNPLQEAIQPEGNVRFAGLLSKLEKVCRALPVPVIAKEVGWGISEQDAKRLIDAGVAAIDVAGAGGTSWSQVEMHRTTNSTQARIARSFLDWGIPTAEAVQKIHAALPDVPLIASGGLHTGVDIAKCIALGATLGGMAGALLRAATSSADAVQGLIHATKAEIRIAMFAAGCADLASLRKVELVQVP